MLNLERLRVLHFLAATGSVVGAARALHVTTSAISQQLARLEREVGEPLVERHGRGVRLTGAGTLLARDAAELLSHVERVEAEVARRRGCVAGPLAVAAFATAARGLLPGVLGALRARHPELAVSVAEREPHEAIPDLVRGTLDIAVVQDWVEAPLALPEGLSRRDLLADVFDAALPAGHPLADRRTVRLGELAGEDWITWTSGQVCHDWLTGALAGASVRHTASEHSTQLALVAAGHGVALIPRLGRDAVPAGVRLVAVDPAPTRNVYALWRTSAAARPAIAATINALTVHCGRSGAVNPAATVVLPNRVNG